jgi:uncharacterized flavoprotein (TIGR03862 family)
MAAETLAKAGVFVTIFDHMATPARKFLLAGRGGLNLTHSEPLETFLLRYGKSAGALAPAIRAFPPDALRDWCEGLGEPTFVGSSGRVFPKSFKAAPLLRAWLRRLDGLGVVLRPRHRWCGWGEDGSLRFEHPGGAVHVGASATVLALGGASWPRMGSDGAWTDILRDAGVSVVPLMPSNCGVAITWSALVRQKFEGMPLKRIALHFAGFRTTGDVVLTARGLEGGAVYALSGPIRDALAAGPVRLCLELRPDLDDAALSARLATPARGRSLGNFLRQELALSPVAIGLIQEARHGTGRTTPLASLLRALPLEVAGVSPIARAISSAGGVAFSEIEESFMLRSKPGVFLAGEMLDWEAPTGGYLLQACFSTGVAAARGAVRWKGLLF